LTISRLVGYGSLPGPVVVVSVIENHSILLVFKPYSGLSQVIPKIRFSWQLPATRVTRDYS